MRALTFGGAAALCFAGAAVADAPGPYFGVVHAPVVHHAAPAAPMLTHHMAQATHHAVSAGSRVVSTHRIASSAPAGLSLSPAFVNSLSGGVGDFVSCGGGGGGGAVIVSGGRSVGPTRVYSFRGSLGGGRRMGGGGGGKKH